MASLQYNTLFKNTLLITIGGALSKVIGFLMLPFYTAWLTTEEYGTVDILTVYASLIMSLTTMCLGESIFVFAKNCDFEGRTKYFSSNVIFSTITILILGILLYVFKKIAILNGTDNTFVNNSFFIFLFVVTGYYQLASQQFVCAINEIKIYSLTGVVMSISTALLSFVLIPQYHITGFVFAGVASNIIATLYTFLFSQSFKFLRLNGFSKKELKEMLRYSIPVMPNSILGWLTIALNRPVMEKYLGLSAIGIFSVSNKFPQLLQMVFNYISTSWNVSLFEEYGKESFEIFFNNILKFIFVILFFVSSVLILSGEYLIQLIADEKFIESYRYIPLLTLGTLFLCMSQIIGSLFAVNKKSKYYFYTTLASSFVAVLCNFMLIPRWGVLGASMSIFFSYLVFLLSRWFVSKQYVRINNISFYIIPSLILVFSSVALWENCPLIYIISGYILLTYFFFLCHRTFVLKIIEYTKRFRKK